MAADAPEDDAGEHVEHTGQPDLTYGAIISPQYAFGTTGRGRCAMCYVEGDKFLHPVGAHIAVYSSLADEMKLIPLADKVMTALAVTLSNNRKYFAVLEEVEDCASQVVSVYSFATEKRVKMLQLGSPTGNDSARVTDISFSENSKFLITQCGGPDHQLLVWRWYTGKLISNIRHDKPILAACFNPVDDTQLAVAHSGGGFLIRLDGEAGNLRPLPVPAAEQTRNAITSMTWLVGNLLAFSSSRGKVQVNQEAEIKAVLRADVEDSLTCIASKGRGFVAAGRKGVLYFFDPPEPSAKRAGNTDPFVLVRSLSCNLPGRSVDSLAMSASEDYAAVLCSSGEMLVLSMEAMVEHEQKELHQLLGHNTLGEQDTDPFTLVGGGVGSPSIVGMDAISHVPLLVIATADKLIRIVNYESRTCVVAKGMIDDIMCCSLHPSGTILAVGLHEKLQLFSVAQDDLGELAGFGVKKCHLARFSSGGGMLAAVGRSNTIYIYHAFTHAQMVVLKGHVSVVTAMAFSPDERSLVSVGAGGSVYFWDLATGRRLADSEYVDKRALYASAAFGGHNGRISAVVRAADGRLQHVYEGKVEYEVLSPKCADRSSIALLGEDRVLLTTNDRGAILSYPWPSSFPAPPGMARFAEAQTYRLHAPASGAITTLIALPQCGIVLTASSDGIVLLSRLDLVLKGQLVEPPPAPWSTAQGGGPMPLTLPVPIERLHHFKAKMVELATLLGTTRSDAEYQSFRQQQVLRETLAKTEAELQDTRKQLADKQAELELVLTSASDKEQAIVKELEAAHMNAADELEALFDQRLELEAQKLKKVAAERDDVQFKLEEQMRRGTSKHQAEVARIKEEHAAAEAEAELQRQRFEHTRVTEHKQFDEYMHQAEGDFEEASDRANMHLDQVKLGANSKESHLKAEVNILKRTNLRFKGEKALELKKMSKVLADNSAMREAVADSQVTISKMERELQGREEVISDNFMTIQGLRRRIQELEKHKFVLAYKADAFSKELDPCKANAEDLGKDLLLHESELLKERTENARLLRLLQEKDSANKIMKRDLDNATMRNAQQENLLGLFSTDVQAVMAASDAKDSAGAKSAQQRALEELYRKYCREWSMRVKTSDQVEAELTRHLHMSEIHKELLQRRIAEGAKLGKSSRHASLHQNMALLRELQVATHDSKQLARTLEDEHSQLRGLSVKYRLLEGRLKGALQDEPDLQLSSKPPGPNASAAATAAALVSSPQHSHPQQQSTARASMQGGTQGSAQLSGGLGQGGPASTVRPTSAYAGSSMQHRRPDAVIRGSPARNLAELLAQEQAGVMAQMNSIMERMAGAGGQARLDAMNKQQAMLESLQRNLKEQLQAEQGQGDGTIDEEGGDRESPQSTQDHGEEGQQGPGHAAGHAGGSQRMPTSTVAPCGNHGGSRRRPTSAVPATGNRGVTAVRDPPSAASTSQQTNRWGRSVDTTGSQGQQSQGGAADARSPYLARAHNAVNRPSTLGPRARPGSASNYTPLLSTSGPTAHSSPVKRRPASAAGVGMRAFVNSTTQAWRDR